MRLALFVLFLGGPACSDAAPTGADGAVASVIVTLNKTEIPSGETANATAEIRASSGRTLDRPVTWTSTNPLVATVAGGLVTGVSPGVTTVKATAAGVSGNTTLVVLVPVTSVSVDVDATALIPSRSVTAVATVRDAQGNALSGRTVDWTSSNTAVATVSSAGVVTGRSPGTTTLTASVERVSATAGIVVSPPAATVAVSLAAHEIEIGELTTARVTARDDRNNVLTGHLIDWSSSNPAVATVSRSGAIQAISAGTVLIVATVDGVSGSVPLTVHPADPTRVVSLALSVEPSASVQSGKPFLRQPQVRLLNSSGGGAARAGVVVSASIASGGGALGGTTSVVTNAEGVAAFTDLAITGVVGPRMLSFASGSMHAESLVPVLVTAGTPAAVGLVVKAPSSVTNGVPFSQQPVVSLRDVSGNTVTQAGIVVTAFIVSGGGVLTGESASTDANGLAAFTGLAVTGIVGERTLNYTAPGVTPVAESITVIPGAPKRLIISKQPSISTQSGVAFAQQPAVQVTDVSGNPVLEKDIVVTASIASGAPVLAGTTTATTNASGVAAFADLKINGLVGSRVLSFTAPTLTGTNTFPVQITAGVASQIVLNVQPSGAAASGDAFVTQPVLAVVDAWKNAVLQPGLDVTASVGSGSATIRGVPTATTNASGAAFFSDLGLIGNGPVTLNFSAGTLGAATANVALAAPIKAVSFDNYSSTAQLRADCSTFFCQEQRLTDDVSNPGFTAGEVSLDANARPPGGVKAMRYHYIHPGNGCNSIVLKRSIRFPPQQGVWAEFQVKWSSNFTTSNQLCSPNDHKLIFGDTESPFNHRWGFYVGSQEPARHAIMQETADQPGNPDGGPKYLNLNPRSRTSTTEVLPEHLWDGNWHSIRFYIKNSTTPSSADGHFKIWIDGKLLHNHLGFNVYRRDGTNNPDRIEGFSFAHNKDDGPAGVDMYIWWGPIRVFKDNPGW